jgi:hypothetical protein
VVFAGPPSSAALTGFPGHALGMTRFSLGLVHESALRKRGHVDSLDT